MDSESSLGKRMKMVKINKTKFFKSWLHQKWNIRSLTLFGRSKRTVLAIGIAHTPLVLKEIKKKKKKKIKEQF